MLIDEVDTRKVMSEPWHRVVFWIFASVMVLGAALSVHIAQERESRRASVVSFLRELDDNITIYVDGRSVDSPDNIILTLLTLRKDTFQHSHPIEMFQVSLEAQEGHLNLVLGRDSRNKTEYWVYLVDKFPKDEKDPSDNDFIGRMDEKDDGWFQRYRPR